MTPAGSSLRILSQFGDWWKYKISYLFVPFYAVLPDMESRLGPVLISFGGLLGYFTVTATFGHIINNLGDIALDARASKINACAGLSKSRIVLMAAAAAAASFAFLCLAGAGALGYALAAAELLLFLAYSLPPLRLKESIMGVFADSAYAHVVPFAIAATILVPQAASADAALVPPLVAAIVWQAFAGLRGIIGHEIEDHIGDAAAGARTAVVRLGPERADALVRRVVAPIEWALLVLALVLLSSRLLLPAVGFACYTLFAWLRQRQRTGDGGSRKWDRRAWDHYLDPFYRRFLPLLVLAGVVIAAPRFWPLLPLHLVLFHLRGRQEGSSGRRNVPKSVITHRLVEDPEGIVIEVEGCYLTSQLTTRTDINIFLMPSINGRDVHTEIRYGPNRYSDFYRAHHIDEMPVCFTARVKALPQKAGTKALKFALDVRWTGPDTSVNLYSEAVGLPTVQNP